MLVHTELFVKSLLQLYLTLLGYYITSISDLWKGGAILKNGTFAALIYDS